MTTRALTIEVVLFALAASGFTALASVAQRSAAAPAPGELSFSWRLVAYLVHRPVWFLGILSMILGFVFQVWALRMGSLSLVQPIIATELVIVFGIMALHDRHRVQARDWVSALGIVVGLGAFLALAQPSNGHQDPSASVWALAGVCALSLAGLLAGLAYLTGRSSDRPSAGRKAALLCVAAATAFGFVAGVVKELGVHLSQGPAGVFGNLVALGPAPFRGGGLLLGVQRLPSRVARCLPAGSDHRRPTGGQHAGSFSSPSGSTSVQRHSAERYWRSSWFWSA
jgi:hypothetical protein